MPPISREAVSLWEKDSGGTNPDINKLNILARAFNCTIADLLNVSPTNNITLQKNNAFETLTPEHRALLEAVAAHLSTGEKSDKIDMVLLAMKQLAHSETPTEKPRKTENKPSKSISYHPRPRKNRATLHSAIRGHSTPQTRKKKQLV